MTVSWKVSPCDKFNKVVGQLYASLAVEDGGSIVAEKVCADHVVVGVAEDPLHRTVGCSLQSGADLGIGGRLLQAHGQVDNRNICQVEVS